MKFKIYAFLVVCATIAGFYYYWQHKIKISNRAFSIEQGTCMVYFSPVGGCTEAICDVLNTATSSIAIQIYTFTSTNIEHALLNAKSRGVKIRLIMDEDMAKKYEWQTRRVNDFTGKGLTVYLDGKHKIAHNKVVIVDDQIVITGSFNWTASAEQKNAENLLVINDSEMASIYVRNWKEHFKHSTKTKKLPMPPSSKEFPYED